MNPSKYISHSTETLDLIPYPAIITDHVGMINAANNLFGQWFQYTENELQDNMTIEQIFSNLDEHLQQKVFSSNNSNFASLSFVTKEESILNGSNFEKPIVKLSVYKNRRGRYKGVYLWCKGNLGTCRLQPMFCTTYDYELLSIEDIKIILEEDSAFEN